MDIASLGISIDTSDVAKATDSLDKVVQSGEKAEKAAEGVAAGFGKASSAAAELTASEGKLAESTDDAKARLLAMAQASLDASEYHKNLNTSLSSSASAMQGAGRATTDWAAVQAQANARGQAILETEARLAEETKKAAAATGIQAEGLQTLLGKINPTLAALQKLDDQQAELTKYQAAGLIGKDDFKTYSADIDAARAKLKGFKDETADSSTGVSKFSLNTKGARENVLQLGNALAEGNIRVAAHNLLEIATSAGASALRLAAMIAPFAAVAAVVGVLGVAYHKGTEEADAYNKALILTGNASGQTASQLNGMAQQISATVGTTGQAAEVLASLASGGKIAGDSFQSVTQAAVSMQVATGKAVSDTVAEFVKLADDPVKASAALNEQYHYLTAAVYSQIEALDKQGDHAGAVKLATEQYADAINERTPKIIENLSLWEKGYNLVAKAADDLKNIGRSNIDSDLSRARENLASAQSGNVGLFQNQKEMVSYYQDQVNLLEDKKAAEADIAKYDAAQAKTQQEAITAMGKVDALATSALSNEEKRNKALKEYAQNLDKIRAANPNDARLNADTVAKNQANIRDQYKDPAAKPSGAVDLSAFEASKNALTGIVADYKNTQQQLDAAQKAGLVSQADYALKREALIGNERDEVTAAYEAEIAALEAVKAKSTTTGAQQIQLDQKIADARADMVKAQKEADSQLEVLATSERGRLAKQELSINTYVQALGQQQKALELAGQRAVLGVGRGDSQTALDNQLNSQQDRFAQQSLELANQKSDPSRNMSEEEFTRKSQALADANKKATDQIKQNYADVQTAQGDWTNGATSAWENYLDSAKNVAGQTKTLFGNAFSSMEDAIVNFATTGKLSFSDFAKSIIADMARIAARQAATGLLSYAASAVTNYFGGSSSATTAGSNASDYTSSAFSSYVSGARASGGPVDANSLYQVNELGPELYSEGGKSYLMTGANGGSVTPLGTGAAMTTAAASGGSGVSINAPVTVVTEDRSSEGMTLDQAALAQNLQTQMKAAAEKAVADSWRPGGTSYKNANGRA
jgi:lambda family phage tail tape measure protein